MAEAKRITIKSREVSGPHQKKDGKGSYKLHKITTTDGEEFSLFGTTNSDNPTVNRKEVVGLDANAVVQMISEKNGKFLKVLDLAVVGGAPSGGSTQTTESFQEESKVLKSKKTTPPWESKTGTTSNTPSTLYAVSTSKDVSMELSGLIQALIGTGHYHTSRQVQLDNGQSATNTYINEKLLEAHVERILTIKDKLAQTRGNK